MIADTHVHLDSEAYSPDLPEILDRARAAGVVAMIAPATHLDSAERILDLARTHPCILPAVGIHPHDAKTFDGSSVARLRDLSPQAVALGETGLDYHYDFSPRDEQLANLRAHLELAAEVGLPVILHCREAEDDLHAELQRVFPLPAGGVVHCFTSGWEWAQRFLELGMHLGVTGMVTFPKLADVHEVARRCPLDRLLVETDGPYLAPIPHRGRRNEPAYVARVVEEVARLRDLPVEEVAQATAAAACRLFGPRLEAALGARGKR